MRNGIIALLLVACSPSASLAAFPCDELWAERNAVYKDAGYCFKTARAIQAFGNAGCRYDEIADVPLSARDRAKVADIVEQERRNLPAVRKGKEAPLSLDLRGRARAGDEVKAIKISALKVGKCYLTNTGRVWRIMQRMPDGRVRYEHRADSAFASTWAPGMLMNNTLPAEVVIEREVRCDLSPDAAEA